MATTTDEPTRECPLCPRLVSFRFQNRINAPDWFNAPVPSFGPPSARILIVGLAPGLKGANRTGRPFTGDYAGVLLYETLLSFGLARGVYAENVNDSLELLDCRITNSVRCVPPQNKPMPLEVQTCSFYLTETLRGMRNLKAVLALGRIAFEATLRALKEKPSTYPFAHGYDYLLRNGVKLYASYHCSRYNTNTGRLTSQMFKDVFAKMTNDLDASSNKEGSPCLKLQ